MFLNAVLLSVLLILKKLLSIGYDVVINKSPISEMFLEFHKKLKVNKRVGLQLYTKGFHHMRFLENVVALFKRTSLKNTSKQLILSVNYKVSLTHFSQKLHFI